MTQNSVLSQNWVGCTPKAQAERTPSLRRRVVARTSRVPSSVTGAHCRVAGPPVTIQKSYCDSTPCRAHYASCRAHTLPYRSTAARYIATQKATPSHDTKFVTRLTPSGKAASARKLAVSQALSQAVSPAWLVVSQPCCTPQHAPSRPYCALAPLLCHDTICCIVTKTGKRVVAHPATYDYLRPFFIFFTRHFFFFLFQLL